MNDASASRTAETARHSARTRGHLKDSRLIEQVRPITQAPHPTSPREEAGKGERAPYSATRPTRSNVVMNSAANLLEARDIAKRFGSVVALRSATLSVRPGEVHALMGANGAGKSTLVKILTGVYFPDLGTIAIRGSVRSFRSPAEARARRGGGRPRRRAGARSRRLRSRTVRRCVRRYIRR